MFAADIKPVAPLPLEGGYSCKLIAQLSNCGLSGSLRVKHNHFCRLHSCSRSVVAYSCWCTTWRLISAARQAKTMACPCSNHNQLQRIAQVYWTAHKVGVLFA